MNVKIFLFNTTMILRYSKFSTTHIISLISRIIISIIYFFLTQNTFNRCLSNIFLCNKCQGRKLHNKKSFFLEKEKIKAVLRVGTCGS